MDELTNSIQAFTEEFPQMDKMPRSKFSTIQAQIMLLREMSLQRDDTLEARMNKMGEDINKMLTAVAILFDNIHLLKEAAVRVCGIISIDIDPY